MWVVEGCYLHPGSSPAVQHCTVHCVPVHLPACTSVHLYTCLPVTVCTCTPLLTSSPAATTHLPVTMSLSESILEAQYNISPGIVEQCSDVWALLRLEPTFLRKNQFELVFPEILLKTNLIFCGSYFQLFYLTCNFLLQGLQTAALQQPYSPFRFKKK